NPDRFEERMPREDYDRGYYGRDLDRGIDRGYDRGYDRGFDRGFDPGFNRGYYDRSFDRGEPRFGHDSDRHYGSDRGWDYDRQGMHGHSRHGGEWNRGGYGWDRDYDDWRRRR
ncbi:MAG: molecular chaperone DnaK, partial [Thermoanaerobaculia bacterium]